MTDAYSIVAHVSLVITVALVVVMLLTFRKPRRITRLSMVLTIAVSLALPFLYLGLTGIRLNPALAWPLLGIGVVLGFTWGFTTKLYVQAGQVVGRRSLLFLFGWGASWILSLGMNLWSSAVLASAGAVPLVFTSGTHVGSSVNILLRRSFYRLPRARARL